MAKKDTREEGDRDVRKLRKFIRGSRVAMFTTVGADGHLRSRPMATVKAEFDGDVWFFTKASAPKNEEIRENANVNVVYADPEDDRYVSVSGLASIERDRAKIEELWSGRLKAWFPEGKTDPDLALIKVHIEHAEYWNSRAGTMVQALGLASAVAGESTRPSAADRKVDAGAKGTPPANPGAAG